MMRLPYPFTGSGESDLSGSRFRFYTVFKQPYSICYSQDNVVRNSINETLSLADNSQTLGFRALMGGFSRGTSRDELLTNEGMSEHLWEMFFGLIKQRMSR